MPASETPKPLRRDAERNRRLILEAARELFAERGIAVSLDDVAARAGVGVGTVYRRFPHRDAIVDELFRERVEQLVANGEAAVALAATDPWAGLVRMLTGYMEIQAGDRSFGPVVMTDAHGRGELDSVRHRLQPLGEQVIRRAKKAGLVREDFASGDFPSLVLMLATLQNAAHEVAPDVWRRQLAIVLDGLRPRPDATPMAAEPLDPAQIPQVMHNAFSTHQR